jgi:hypothetical protein
VASRERSSNRKNISPVLPARLGALATALQRTEWHLDFMTGLMMHDHIVRIMNDPKFDDPLRLEPKGYKVHSQYDEDGIIDEIFKRIGTTNRAFIQFGAGNGTENCTGFLLMQGWRGLWMDGVTPSCRRLISVGSVSWRAIS